MRSSLTSGLTPQRCCEYNLLVVAIRQNCLRVVGEIGHLHLGTAGRCRSSCRRLTSTAATASRRRLTAVLQLCHLALYPLDLPETLQPVTGVRSVVLFAQTAQYLRRQLQQETITYFPLFNIVDTYEKTKKSLTSVCIANCLANIAAF